MNPKYIDKNNQTVKQMAHNLTARFKTPEDKVRAIFNYVRDGIEFAFLEKADFYTAEEIIQREKGQCNNKTIVFQALCEAAGIKSRMHFSSISKEIHRGLFKGLVFEVMPEEISHSWMEVELSGKWFTIDSYINDLKFYNGGKAKLLSEGKKTGYSVSCAGGESSAELDFDNEAFVQMGAVKNDHGTYTDPNDYFKSPDYKNDVNPAKMLIYRKSLKEVNKRVDAIRDMG